MNRRWWQTSVTITSLIVVSVALAGCPKKPAPAPEAGTGSGAAGPSAGGTTGSGAGGAGAGAGGSPGTGGTIGTGPGAAGGGAGTAAGTGAGPSAGGGATGPGAAGPGVAGATGTTIPALPSPKEFAETSALRDIFFDFDKYEIRPQDAKVLEDNAKWLGANPNALLLIEGHCDERGTNEYNLALGERRAKATRDHLVSLGVSGSRITLISYGEERPVCTDRNEGCWTKNRRAHFLVKQ